MSEKNKPAEADRVEKPAQSPLKNGAEPDPNVDSELDIQDLLKKYLPNYEVKPAEDSAAQKDSDGMEIGSFFISDPASAAGKPSGNAPEKTADETKESSEARSSAKPNLFSRLRGAMKEAKEARREAENEDDEVRTEAEDTAVPDSGLFERLVAEAQPEDDAPTIPSGTPADKAAAPEEVPADEEIGSGEAADVMDASDESESSDKSDVEEVSDAADESKVGDDAGDAGKKQNDADEMDDTDRNLMVAFGLEDQLDRKAGAGTADAVAAQNAEEIRRRDEEQRRALEYEYTERSQTPKIAAAYTSTLRSLKIKMIVGAVLSVILFFFENITLFGVQHGGVFDPAVFPVVYIMASLQLTLLVCAVAYEQILPGLRNLVTGRPTPESVTGVLAIFAILYSAYEAIVSVQGVEPVMYNFAVAFCAMLSLIYAYVNTKREVFSFNIVSSKKPKYLFRRVPEGAESPESAAFGETGEDAPDVLQISRAGFVDGYFGRTSAILHSTRVYVGAMLTVICAAAVLMAIVAALRGAAASGAVTVAYICVLAAIPMSMFFTYSYPLYRANREAYEYESTIVGDSSVEEYAGSSIISFDDTNVFPSYSVKVQNIKVYNNNRIDRVLYYAASAFAAAGGPLNDVFDVATMEMGHSDDVEILEAASGCLETRVDGRRILFGRSDVLTEKGVDIPEEIVEEDSYIEGDFSIMYMVCDGDLVAKMYIKYIMDADFEFIVRQFTQNGTCVCVKTLDPNIDENMIFSKVKGKKYPLRVIKRRDDDAVLERADSGVVTRGTTKSLLQVISFCDMVMNVKRSNTIISIVAAVLTVFIMFVVSISGSVGRIGSWLIVLYQLFWFIPGLLTAKFNIR